MLASIFFYVKLLCTYLLSFTFHPGAKNELTVTRPHNAQQKYQVIHMPVNSCAYFKM